MDAQKIGSFLFHLLVFFELINTAAGLFLCIRKHRAQPGGGSVSRYKAADFLIILCGCSIHIHAYCTVSMYINKAWDDFFPNSIINLRPFFRTGIWWKD